MFNKFKIYKWLNFVCDNKITCRYRAKQDLYLSDDFGSVTVLKQGTNVTIIRCAKNKIIFETLPWGDKNIRYMSVKDFNNSFEKL